MDRLRLVMMGPSGRWMFTMVRQLTATQVKARILGLLNEVAGGEEIEITKHGAYCGAAGSGGRSAALKERFAGVAFSTPDDEQLFSTGADWESAGRLS